MKMEKNKVGCYEFMAEPFHCDVTKKLFMGHLGNHLLNAADFHSQHRGFGMSYLNSINKTWVLSRLTIEMEEMPAMYSKFFVETWVENAMRFFTNRNFKVTDVETGKVYGYGRSVWAMIDTVTRQPASLMEINEGSIIQYVEKEKPCPIGKITRVKVAPDAPLANSFVVNYNDIDINGHLNSVKYVEHVLDLFSMEWMSTHRLQRMEIAYIMEAHWGEKVNIYFTVEDDGLTYHIRLTRMDPDKEEEVEISRCLAKFVKD